MKQTTQSGSTSPGFVRRRVRSVASWLVTSSRLSSPCFISRCIRSRFMLNTVHYLTTMVINYCNSMYSCTTSNNHLIEMQSVTKLNNILLTEYNDINTVWLNTVEIQTQNANLHQIRNTAVLRGICELTRTQKSYVGYVSWQGRQRYCIGALWAFWRWVHSWARLDNAVPHVSQM